MSVNGKLAGLIGNWKGTNKLYLPWEENGLYESESNASMSLKVDGQFIEIDYTWSYKAKPQEGMLIIGCDNKTDAVQAVWTDSWHNQDKLMLCDGTISDGGIVSVKGYYSVPDHPDWGWRTEINPGESSFRYVMYNVSPEGEETLAVMCDFTRA